MTARQRARQNLPEVNISIKCVCSDLDLVHYMSWPEGEADEREPITVNDGSSDVEHLPLLLLKAQDLLIILFVRPSAAVLPPNVVSDFKCSLVSEYDSSRVLTFTSGRPGESIPYILRREDELSAAAGANMAMSLHVTLNDAGTHACSV
jgi:hypothetical protein